MADSQTPFTYAGHHVKQDPVLESGETFDAFKDRVIALARIIVGSGLYTEDGRLHFHDNLRPVRRELETLTSNDREIMMHSNDDMVRACGCLFNYWDFSFIFEKHQPLEDCKANGLERMGAVLDNMKRPGFQFMPVAQDAYGRRIGDGSPLIP